MGAGAQKSGGAAALPAPPPPRSLYHVQRAKKVVSNSPGLVDFAIGLVNSVFNLPDRQVMFFEEFELQRDCETNSARQKAFGAS